MGTDDFLWKAFLLNGSVTAYLVYRGLLDAKRMDNGENEGFDN